MGITIELKRNGRVILQTYTDPLDMQELVAMPAKLQHQYLDHASSPVHTLIDARALTQLPTNFLSGGTSSIRNVHPMGGEIVIVTSNTFIYSMSQIFKRLTSRYRVSLFKSIDEGWKEIDRILTREDETITAR